MSWSLLKFPKSALIANKDMQFNINGFTKKEDVMLKKISGIFIMVICILATPLVSEGWGSKFIIENPVFLKVNIHFQDNGRDCKASYANYTNPGAGHQILPVNTPVKIKKWKRGFIIVDSENNKEIYFEYSKRRMQMSIEEYLKHITSPSKVDLGKFSDIDRKGIREGKAYTGMTKDGVMMALGYPATHRTPSPDSNRWIYWTNRFGTIAVTFNEKGVVTNIKD